MEFQYPMYNKGIWLTRKGREKLDKIDFTLLEGDLEEGKRSNAYWDAQVLAMLDDTNESDWENLDDILLEDSSGEFTEKENWSDVHKSAIRRLYEAGYVGIGE